MSKLDDILEEPLEISGQTIRFAGDPATELALKELMLELIGELEQRETDDMSLKSWTNEDYKVFGKNELKIELRQKVEEL